MKRHQVILKSTIIQSTINVCYEMLCNTTLHPLSEGLWDKPMSDLKSKSNCNSPTQFVFFYSGHCKVFNFFHSSESWLLESLLCICGPPGGVLATMVRIFRLIFGSTLSPPIPFLWPHSNLPYLITACKT